jgi:transcriptional regulator with XRE-family HTH domain
MKTASDQATLLSLGKRIAELRRKREITLDDLSRRMRISKGNLSDIERGKRDPRFLTLLAISQGLGASIADLMGARLTAARKR